MSNAVVFWKMILQSLHLNVHMVLELCVQPYCLWTHGKILWSLLCVELVHEAGDYFHLHSATLLTQVISSAWAVNRGTDLWWPLDFGSFPPTPCTCALVSNSNMECKFHTTSRLIYIVFSAVLLKPVASQYLLFNFSLAQNFPRFWPLQLTNQWFSHKCCVPACAEFMSSCMSWSMSAWITQCLSGHFASLICRSFSFGEAR